MLDTTHPAIACQIVTMTNEDRDFYSVIGPFLARRAIIKELGEPLWDDDGMRWFIALAPSGAVLGFAVLMPRGKVLELTNSYVLPEWRGRGIYRQLLTARLEAVPVGTALRALTTSKSVNALLRRGFVVRRQRGQYTEVEMVKKEG